MHIRPVSSCIEIVLDCLLQSTLLQVAVPLSYEAVPVVSVAVTLLKHLFNSSHRILIVVSPDHRWAIAILGSIKSALARDCKRFVHFKDRQFCVLIFFHWGVEYHAGNLVISWVTRIPVKFVSNISHYSIFFLAYGVSLCALSPAFRCNSWVEVGQSTLAVHPINSVILVGDCVLLVAIIHLLMPSKFSSHRLRIHW